MRTMHQIEEQANDCLGSQLRDLAASAEPPAGAGERPTDSSSFRLLATPEHEHDTAVLNVHGEIDLETAPVLWEALLPILEHHIGPVVVDLSDVEFMDSTGVHVLVQTGQRLEPKNRRLAIVCPEGGTVHRLLGLLGLLDTMAVHRSRASALVGGDGLLRSEPDRDSSPSKARALTHSRVHTDRQTPPPPR